VFNYKAPPTAPGSTAERFGLLNNTTAGGVFTINGTAAGGHQSPHPQPERHRRADHPRGQPRVGHLRGEQHPLFIDGLTTNVSVLTNVFFANTSGTGTSSVSAGLRHGPRDHPFVPPPASGTTIDNVNAPNTSTIAAFTTTGNTVANTGVSVYSLTLDGGATLTLNGGTAAQAGNGNTADGTC